MKKIVLFSILLVAFNSFSQEKLLDYFVDKKGDTIYGIVRDNLNVGIYDYISSHPNSPSINNYTFKLVEENKDIKKKKLYIEHNLKKLNVSNTKEKFSSMRKWFMKMAFIQLKKKKILLPLVSDIMIFYMKQIS